MNLKRVTTVFCWVSRGNSRVVGARCPAKGNLDNPEDGNDQW